MFQAKIFGLAVLTCLVCVRPVSADFSVVVDGGDFQVGRTSTLNVTLAPENPPELLTLYDVTIRISPLSATSGTVLQFVDPQSEGFLDAPDYVFFNDSESFASGSFATSVSSFAATGDTLRVNDFTASFGDVGLTGSSLLFSFELQHLFPGGTDPKSLIGDTYEISLVSAVLEDASANSFTVSSSTSGFINIVAIPEPNAIALLTLVVGSGLTLPRRRR